jgi:hypothetical protein
MTNEEFAQALREMGYGRERFAQIVRVKSTTTIENWATGNTPVPGLVEVVVSYMLARPESRKWFEEFSPPGQGAVRADKKRRMQLITTQGSAR